MSLEEAKYILQGNNINMRFVRESDAKFIVDLRTDKKLKRFISWTSSSIEKQTFWIRKYIEREKKLKEYYFIFEDAQHNPWGTIRIYNLTKSHFTIGSWVCLPGDNNKIAIKAWLIAIRFGFNNLGKERCLLDVRKKNYSVLSYIRLFQPEFIKENNFHKYFSLEKENFQENQDKVINLLNIKL